MGCLCHMSRFLCEFNMKNILIQFSHMKTFYARCPPHTIYIYRIYNGKLPVRMRMNKIFVGIRNVQHENY